MHIYYCILIPPANILSVGDTCKSCSVVTTPLRELCNPKLGGCNPMVRPNNGFQTATKGNIIIKCMRSAFNEQHLEIHTVHTVE